VTPEAEQFLGHEVLFEDVGAAEIAYRKVGTGRPLVLVHGWPFWGFSYRKLLPRLAAHHTCYVLDLPGAGLTRWREENDFRFPGQARNVARFVEHLGLDGYDVLAHDTGATIMREVALTAGERLRKLVIMNTEIPGHRPPWIPLHQRAAALPGANLAFRLLLRSRTFIRSSMGFGNVFLDPSLLEGEFEEQFIRPLIADARRMEGQLRYLRGIDWGLVDGLATRHASLRQPVLLVWGADDPTFPLSRAGEMVRQLPSCAGLKAVPGAKLLVHEEQPAAVAGHVLDFLRT
jgi:haloalkane dehalogenase